jgi:hypothetical protein
LSAAAEFRKELEAYAAKHAINDIESGSALPSLQAM